MSLITKNCILNGNKIKLLYKIRHFTSLQTNGQKCLYSSVYNSLSMKKIHFLSQSANIFQQNVQVLYQSTRNCSKDSKKVKPIVRKEIPVISWRNLGIMSVFGVTLYGAIVYKKAKKQRAFDKEKRQVIGKADIGGNFQLYDHNNVLVNSEDFLGSWILIYFGFTHCPDVCPDELEKIADVVDILDNESKKFYIQPLFITVDPMRDSAAAIKNYLKEFHSRFIGLTGTNEMIASVCKKFRVYFSEGPKDQDNDYIVDHTIVSYLIDPKGNFVDYYGQNTTAKEIADKIIISGALFDRATIMYAKNRSPKKHVPATEVMQYD